MFDFLSVDGNIFRAGLNFVFLLKDSITLNVLVSSSILLLIYLLGLGIGALLPPDLCILIQSN